MSIRRAILATSLLWAFTAPASADPARVFEKSRLEIAPGTHPITQLTIDNPLGNVRIEGYDGKSIQIETHKAAADEDSLDRLRVSLVPNPDGSVRIVTTADGGREVKPIDRRAVHIDLVIRAPRDARIAAAISAGTLEVINMDAGSDLDTGSGAILVRNVAGSVETHTVSGPTSLTQVFGSVDAQTLASDLVLDTIGGDHLIASAHHGKIAGRRVRAREVELTTTDGKITLEAEASLHGHLVVSSLRGDVDVRLHRHGGVVVRARGTKIDLGAATRPLHDGWVEASLGGPHGSSARDGDEHPALLELQSSHGNVQFVIVE